MVCTANICRSPMAEGWARARGAEVRSGGIMGLEGRKADPLAVRVMREKDIDISGHVSSGISDEDMRWADHVLVMEMRHRVHLVQRHPDAIDKILLLGQFGGQHELSDPVGGWRWRFRRSRDDITRCLDGFLHMAPQPTG
jgi:protein-tyrosine phosphatase